MGGCYRGGGGGLLTTGPIVNESVVNSRVNDPLRVFWFWVVIRYCALREICAT